MLDCHTHILAGVDDGAPTPEVGLALVRRLQEVGVTTVVATPHWCSPRFAVVVDGVMQAWEVLRQQMASTGLTIHLELGAEHHLSGLQGVDSFVDCLRPLGGSRCVLIELPDDHLPHATWSTLFAVTRAGFRPLIAHPERCKGLAANDPNLRAYVEGGGLLQLTLGHLIGAHGLIMRWRARRLLKRFPHGCILASDSHDLGPRRPRWDQLPERWRHLAPDTLTALERWH